jgi:hypothetical protein
MLARTSEIIRETWAPMRSKRLAPLEYFVRQNAGGWQVLLGAQVLSDHATYRHAYRAVEAEANRAVERGQPSKIVVGPVGGVRVEFPVMEPERAPPDRQVQKKPRR